MAEHLSGALTPKVILIGPLAIARGLRFRYKGRTQEGVASMDTQATGSWAAIVPAYREAGRIGEVVKGIRRHCERVIVIDDGSPDETAAEARAAGATVLVHEHNRGKGAALQTGFAFAREQGLDFVVTLDADGQHDPSQIPDFITAHRAGGAPVIVGNRMSDPRTMPLVRRLTNRFMSGLLSRRMGQRVHDTQNGYRLYATDVLEHVRAESSGFAAESEVLLNLAAAGVRIGEVPVTIIYGDEKSKIRPVRDTIRFFRMLKRFERRREAEKAKGQRT